MEVKEMLSPGAAADPDIVIEEMQREVSNGPRITIRDNQDPRAGTLEETTPRRQAHDYSAALHATPFRHIVVAVDGSELAEEIFPVVVPLARAFGSHITLLRVVAPVKLPIYAGDMAGYSPRIDYEDLLAMSQRARLEASDYVASRAESLEAEDLAITYRTLEGSPAERIVDHARAVGADLIAMTTHGRGGLGRLVFGSVAEEVLRSAPCPVLLARVQDS